MCRIARHSATVRLARHQATKISTRNDNPPPLWPTWVLTGMWYNVQYEQDILQYVPNEAPQECFVAIQQLSELASRATTRIKHRRPRVNGYHTRSTLVMHADSTAAYMPLRLPRYLSYKRLGKYLYTEQCNAVSIAVRRSAVGHFSWYMVPLGPDAWLWACGTSYVPLLPLSSFFQLYRPLWPWQLHRQDPPRPVELPVALSLGCETCLCLFRSAF